MARICSNWRENLICIKCIPTCIKLCYVCCASACTHTHTHRHTQAHTRTHTRTRAHTHTHTHTHRYTHTHVATAFTRKKAVANERKQKKEQKDEAERYVAKQKELVRLADCSPISTTNPVFPTFCSYLKIYWGLVGFSYQKTQRTH